MINLTPCPSFESHFHVLIHSDSFSLFFTASLFSCLPFPFFYTCDHFLNPHPLPTHTFCSLFLSLYSFLSLSRCSNVIRCTEWVVSAPVTALRPSPLACLLLLPISYYQGRGHKGQVLYWNQRHSGSQSLLVMELWPGFPISTSDLCSFSSSNSPQLW